MPVWYTSTHPTLSSYLFPSPTPKSDSSPLTTLTLMPLTRYLGDSRIRASTRKCPDLEISWTYKSRYRNNWTTYANRRGYWWEPNLKLSKPLEASRRGWRGHVYIRHWQTCTHEWSLDPRILPLTAL